MLPKVTTDGSVSLKLFWLYQLQHLAFMLVHHTSTQERDLEGEQNLDYGHD